ncbi:MAG: hypothetical protein LCH93_01170 [Proteobacteria bacterium]|nr:hypothetical protein [Pseudomonadota bacterium]
MITYAQACRDPHLFGPWFPVDTFGVWHVIDKALFGEPLNFAELLIWRQVSGRNEAPTRQAAEAWLIMGRRSSKSVKAASIAVYLATFGNERFGFSRRLKPGERGVAQILATDKDTASIVFGYAVAMFKQPLFAQLLSSVTADTIELKNGLAIEVVAASARRSRGRSTFAVILEELAHWLGESRSVNPDTEIYNAVLPGMATMAPHAMVIAISSPLARSGLLHDKYEAHFGKPGRTLVVQVPTWIANPTLSRDDPEGIIAKAYAADPVKADAEFGAQFRSELNALLEYEVIASAVDRGTFERPPLPHLTYHAFADISGGRNDPSTLGIAHMEDGRAVLDCLRVAPAPHEPAHAIADFAKTLAAYGIGTVTGDNYAGNFVEGAFRDHGIEYQKSRPSRSELYLELLPLMNSHKVVLLDNGALIKELAGLERRAAGRGRDSVDHGKAKGSHDDRANVLAGAVFVASTNVSVTLAPGDPGFFKLAVGDQGFKLTNPGGLRRSADRPPRLRGAY